WPNPSCPLCVAAVVASPERAATLHAVDVSSRPCSRRRCSQAAPHGWEVPLWALPLLAAALAGGSHGCGAVPCGLAAGGPYARRRCPYRRQPCPQAIVTASGCPYKGLPL
ncbi:hypothetical protein BHM03_00046340, partial [Ensete ventricosum]